MGSFKNSINPELETFNQLPNYVENTLIPNFKKIVRANNNEITDDEDIYE